MRLEHLSEKVATFISRALEASSSIDSRLLLFKLASRRFGIARLSVLLCACAPRNLCHPSIVDFIVKC
jgi:hypothetical protein